jgi:predicted metalloprotease
MAFPLKYFNGLAQQGAITYRNDVSPMAASAVVAHEIGHHVLGHLELRGYSQFSEERGGNWVNERGEREAEIFAAALTALTVFFEYSQRTASTRRATHQGQHRKRVQRKRR